MVPPTTSSEQGVHRPPACAECRRRRQTQLTVLTQLLIGDDGSAGSAAALAWAEEVAGAMNANTTVLRVPDGASAAPSTSSSQTVGSPVPALLAAAKDLAADLIVVGRRGAGGFETLRLGSTAHQLAEHSDRPVAVVPSGGESRWPFSVIAVGHDGSTSGDAALSWTASLAAAAGAPVVVIHAIDVAPAFVLAAMDSSYEATLARMAEVVDREWCAPLRASGLEYSTVVEEGGAAATLLGVVRSRSVDVLVVGRDQPSSFPGLAMGSVAHRAIGFSPCPTIVVPHAG